MNCRLNSFMAAWVFALICGTAIAGDEADEPAWARSKWMAHDTAKQVQMAYRYAQARDFDKALEHLLIAAQRGYPQAQAQVGFYFEQGRGGVAIDRIEAVKWYLLSREPSALGFAERLAESMSPEQYAEAEQRVADWRPVSE